MMYARRSLVGALAAICGLAVWPLTSLQAADPSFLTRGGSTFYDERFSRTTTRFPMPPHITGWTPTGFRVVLNAAR